MREREKGHKCWLAARLKNVTSTNAHRSVGLKRPGTQWGVQD